MHGRFSLRQKLLLIDNLGCLVQRLLLTEYPLDAHQHVMQLVARKQTVVVLIDETQYQIDLFRRDQLRHQRNRNQKIENVASVLGRLAALWRHFNLEALKHLLDHAVSHALKVVPNDGLESSQIARLLQRA